MSFTVILNVIAGLVLALIYAAFVLAGTAGLVVLPIYMLFLLFGLPWTVLPPGPSNVLNEILTIRGVFINATIVGVLADAWHYFRPHRSPDTTLAQYSLSLRGHPIQLVAAGLVVLVVLGMVVLPVTHYGRLTTLRAGWDEMSQPVTMPLHERPPASSTLDSATRQIQDLLTREGLPEKGRRDVSALADATASALRIPLDDGAGITAAERGLSAAILCMASSNQRNYGNGRVTIRTVAGAVADTEDKKATLKAFIARLRGKYTVPEGNGCR